MATPEVKPFKKNCPFCDKKGLAILPVRYAVAHQAAGDSTFARQAPKLTADFTPGRQLAPGNKGGSDIDLKPAQYTLRALRSGYLYVFNEALGQWSAYIVTEDACLFRFDPKQQPPDLGGVKFSCDPNTHGAVASCICIPDARHASKVWFAFAETPWTDKVFEHNRVAANRQLHMQCVDIQQWLASKKHPPAAPISALQQRVCEYLPPAGQGNAAPRFSTASPFAWHGKAASTAYLQAWAKQVSPDEGMLLAVNDPAGLLQELAVLMHSRTRELLNQQKYSHGLACSAKIAELRAAIEQQGENSARQAAEQQAGQYIGDMSIAGVLFPEAVQKGYDILRKLTPAEQANARAQRWKPYEAQLKTGALQTFKATLDIDLKTLDQHTITPLCRAYNAWLDAAKAWFAGNHDSADLYSGIGYAKTLTNCLYEVGDKLDIVIKLQAWLSAGKPTPDNLLCRAVAFNQDKLIEQVQKVQKLPLSQWPWRALFDSFNKLRDELVKKHPTFQSADLGSLLEKLVAAISPAMLRLLAKPASWDMPQLRWLLGVLGVSKNQAVLKVQVKGTRKQFISALSEQVLSLAPGDPNAAAVKGAVRREVQRLQLKGDYEAPWLIMVDIKQLEKLQFPTGSRGAKDQALASLWLKPEQLDELAVAPLRKHLAGIRRGTPPTANGAIGGLLQLLAYHNALNDLDKALAYDDPLTAPSLKLGAMAAGFFNGVTETLEGIRRVTALGKGALAEVSYVGIKATSGLVIVGRLLGAIGGALQAYLDAKDAIEQGLRGRIGLAALFGASFFLGITTTAMALGWIQITACGLAATGWLVIFAAALLAIGVLLSWLKPDAIQDWLQDCYFGTAPKPDYKNNWPAEERALQKALA